MILQSLTIIFLFISYKIGLCNFEETFKQICNELASINILFVKILQWFTYNFTHDREISNRLFKFINTFCNNAPYTQDDICDESIEFIHALKDDNGEKLIVMETTPAFSGTIALCYLAEMKGKKIIIKILRKNLHKKLIEFENLFYSILYVLSWIDWLGMIPNGTLQFIRRICLNTITSFKKQCDLEQECKNIEVFYSMYADVEDIKIPQVYTEFTQLNKNILVMEYLQPKYSILDLTNIQAIKSMETITNFLFTSYFTQFIFHNDLHLGNVLFLEDESTNKLVIGVIDFGYVNIIKNIDEQDLSIDFWNMFIEKFNRSLGNDLIVIMGEFIIKHYYKYNIENDENNCKLEKLQLFLNLHREKMCLLEDNLLKNEHFIELYLFLTKEDIQMPPTMYSFLTSISPIIGTIHKLAEIAHLDNINVKGPTTLLIENLKKQIHEYYQQY